MAQLNKYYRRITQWILLSAVWAIVLQFELAREHLRFVFLAFIIVQGFDVVRQTLKMVRLLPGKPKLIWVLCGWVVFFCGIGADVLTAAIQALDWNRQIYTVIDIFVELGFGYNHVHYLGFLAQIWLLVASALLWVAFLKSYPMLVRRLQVGSPLWVCSMMPLLMAFSIHRCYLYGVCLDALSLPLKGMLPLMLCLGLLIYGGITYQQIRTRKFGLRLANAEVTQLICSGFK